jgi:hypothetical protein
MSKGTFVWTFNLGNGSFGEAARREADSIGDAPLTASATIAFSCRKKQSRRRLPLAALTKKRFLTGVSAWRIGNQFALSNFVLIPST